MKIGDNETYVTDGIISTARPCRLIMVSLIVIVAIQPLNPWRETIWNIESTLQSVLQTVLDDHFLGDLSLGIMGLVYIQ